MDLMEEEKFSHPTKERNKRRSSFFTKRLSFYSSEISRPESPHDGDLLKRYIDELKQEDQKWKELYSKLKKKNKELKEKCTTVIDQNSWNDLNESDRQFLLERPNYLAMAKLADSTAESMAIRQCYTVSTCDAVYHLVQQYQALQAQVTQSITQQMISDFDELNLLQTIDTVCDT